MNFLKGLCLCVFISLTLKDAMAYIRVCYYTNWSQFKPVPYNLYPSQIPSRLCTHIVFAYAKIRGSNVTTTEFHDVRMYSRLNLLRRDNPSLQLLLAIGGWATGGSDFSRLVSNQRATAQFADNLVVYLRQYSFDGVTIDWQYPTVQDRGSNSGDRYRYTRLLKTVQDAFELESKSQNRTRLSLSATVEANITEARIYYETKRLGNFLDWAFLAAYDFYGYWDLNTGAMHHSSLYPDIGRFVEEWMQDGFPVNKLVLGVSGFGRSFTLDSEPSGNGLGQPVTSGGGPGDISGSDALLEYGEICNNVVNRSWQGIWLDNQSVPIAYGNTSGGWQWVGYDNPRSVKEKARFIRQNNLAGVMFWSLDRDDFTNICGRGRWPLMRTLARELPVNSTAVVFNKTTTEAPRPVAVSETTSITTTKVSKFNNNQTTETTANQQPGPFNVTEHRNVSSTTLETPQKLKSDPENISSSILSKSTTTATTASYNDNPQKNLEDSVTSLYTSGDESKHSLEPGGVFIEDDIKFVITNTPKTPMPFRQCKVSRSSGPALICPSTKSKPGDRESFYLFCASGFLAIECRCLPGHFFNRCLSVCDKDDIYKACPLVN